MELPPFTASALGLRIRKQRQRLELTQAEVARAVGVSRKFMVELKAGKESASLGLTLKVLQELGFEESATKQIPDRSDDIARAFQQTLATEDYEYALRLVSEYTAESLQAGRPLLRKAPELDDKQYIVALAALTRWVAAKTRSITPSWALNVSPSAEPVFLSEKIYPVRERMKELIRIETPAELKGINVWMRERSLAIG